MAKTVKIGNQIIDPANPGIDRPVVIKEFDLDDPGAERAIEMLSYGFPCVPKLYQIEKTEDSVCIYQEFIEGTHLYDLHPETLPEVVSHVQEIVRSLRLVHKQAEAVRDITPDNVIFREGQALFIDLSTTSTEFTPGFKPPEVDGGLTGGYSRASDIYQIGIILKQWLEKVGQESKSLTNLVAHCLREEPGKRPTAEVLFYQLGQIQEQFSATKDRSSFKWPFLVFPALVAIVMLVMVLAFGIKDRTRSGLRVSSAEDVWKVRAKVALAGDSEKAKLLRAGAAQVISKFLTEETLLTLERMDALFLTKNLLIICEGKPLGLGSRVVLDGGETGYISGHSSNGIEIKTPQEIRVLDTSFSNMRVGFSTQNLPSLRPITQNIFIREKFRNLDDVLKNIALHSRLSLHGEIKGSTAGFFEATTIKEFLDKYKDEFGLIIEHGQIRQEVQTAPLFFPVQAWWLSPKCHIFEEYLAAEVENCSFLEDNLPLFSYSNTLENLLKSYHLKLEETESGYILLKIE